VFEAAGSILLALTKCNDQGKWIKSMFGDGTNENLANVQIHKLNNDKSISGFDVTIDRSNLTKTATYGLATEKIPSDKPWQVVTESYRSSPE
jgi:hypothetical protein